MSTYDNPAIELRSLIVLYGDRFYDLVRVESNEPSASSAQSEPSKPSKSAPTPSASPEVVWKFQLVARPGLQRVKLPAGAQLLTFAAQRGLPMLWFKCRPGNECKERVLILATTGEVLDELAGAPTYVGSALLNDGALMLHCFDLGWSEAHEVLEP